MKNKAVFLDRDGTIIEDKGYLSDPTEITFMQNAIPALQLLRKHNFKLIITTNQSGIERRYFDTKRLYEIHDKLRTLLSLNRIKLDAIYYCPHHPARRCSCRKPRIGMALRARKELNINLKKSFGIGDKISDVKFAKNFGGKAILVLTGLGEKEKVNIKNLHPKKRPDYIAKDIYDAARWIIQNST